MVALTNPDFLSASVSSVGFGVPSDEAARWLVEAEMPASLVDGIDGVGGAGVGVCAVNALVFVFVFLLLLLGGDVGFEVGG